MGGAADHASDVDHADIKRLQMDYAFEKMIDDMEERDWICDEEMEILCDHFDPKHQRRTNLIISLLSKILRKVLKLNSSLRKK